MATISKCTQCDSTLFFVNEGVSHKAEVLPNGDLHLYKENWSSEIECIICQGCGEEYSVDDFKSLQY